MRIRPSRPDRRIPRRRSWPGGEAGLAFVDAMVGMALFALVALIALQSQGQYRQTALMTGAVADARAAGVAIEADGAYPNSIAHGSTSYVGRFPDGSRNIAKFTAGNRMVNYVQITDSESGQPGYAFCIQRNSSTDRAVHAVYNSLRGGLVSSSPNAGCPASVHPIYDAP